MGMTLSVRSPDELIAVIPHMLGFQPEESLVFVPMGSDLPVARVDIPITPRDQELVWQSIRDGLRRYAQPSAAVGIVCFTAERATADLVVHEFADRLDTIGIDTRVRLWADETLWSDLDSGYMGLQTEAARERVAALTVLGGRAQPPVSRESLA